MLFCHVRPSLFAWCLRSSKKLLSCKTPVVFCVYSAPLVEHFFPGKNYAFCLVVLANFRLVFSFWQGNHAKKALYRFCLFSSKRWDKLWRKDTFGDFNHDQNLNFTSQKWSDFRIFLWDSKFDQLAMSLHDQSYTEILHESNFFLLVHFSTCSFNLPHFLSCSFFTFHFQYSSVCSAETNGLGEFRRALREGTRRHRRRPSNSFSVDTSHDDGSGQQLDLQKTENRKGILSTQTACHGPGIFTNVCADQE